MAAAGALPPGIVAGVLPLGTELIVRYGCLPLEDHLRVVIGHITHERYIVMDPDLEVYEEEMVADGVDTLAIWVLPPGGMLPFGHPGDGAYLHDWSVSPGGAGPTPGQLAGLLVQGQAEANRQRALQGLAAVPVAAAGAARSANGPEALLLRGAGAAAAAGRRPLCPAGAYGAP